MQTKKSSILDKVKKSKSKNIDKKKGKNVEALINSGKYRFNDGSLKKTSSDESI